jgi:hypothetical protein
MARNEALRRELLARAARPAAEDNADRLWSILDDYEAWPGFRLVDPDGEHAAWLIAQLGDTDLQRRCLEHLEVAVDNGDAPPGHYACLLDRVRMAEGRPQLYGSQWVVNEHGDLSPWPIENPSGVDVRRERVGLQPLAVQRAIMQSEYAAHGAPEWPLTSPPPRG